MKNEVLLSIVIPFYNVDQYITQCLESVYNQDMPEDEYEVICVNDASPDKSREIVLEFQKKHSNLILVEHDVNKKLGAARNTGRAIAKGKYIWNVDSDDFIQPNCLKHLVDVCEENQLDVLMFNFDHLKGDHQSLNEAFPFPDSDVYTGIEYIKKYALGNFNEISPVWTQWYRKDFLDKKDIYSPPINMGEDVPYTFKALLLADRIKSITASSYVYRMNEDSLTQAIKSNPIAKKNYENSFVCAKHIAAILPFIPVKEQKIYEEYLNVGKYVISLIFKDIEILPRQEKRKIKTILRSNFVNDVRALNKLFSYKTFSRYLLLLI